jgi:hypothetical protein
MSVRLMGSPENRRLLREVAIAQAIVAETDVNPSWEVKIGSPIYNQIVAPSGELLMRYAPGSVAWAEVMSEMDAGVPPSPPITLGPIAIVALDATATWSGGTGPFTIDWGEGAGPIGATSPATHTYAVAGAYTVTVEDSLGATASETANPVILQNLVDNGEPVGPFLVFGTAAWGKRVDGVCYVGFDIDADPEPDVWFTWQQIRQNPDLTDDFKAAIRVQLDAFGC